MSDFRPSRRALFGIGASAAAVVAVGTPAVAAPGPSDASLAASLGLRSGRAAGLNYVTGGRGEPLVLLPGWPQTWWEFHKILPALARRYRVIAVDLPRNTAGDKKSMAAAVHGLVRALGLSSVHIAGHDIGAMVAFSFAANHRSSTKTVTVIDVPHPDESLYQIPLLMPPGTVYPWWFAFNQVRGLPEQLLVGRSRALMDYLCSLLLVDQAAVDGRSRAVYAAAYADVPAIRAGNAWYQAFHQDIEDQKSYGVIAVPMLGIASLASPYLGQALTARGSDVRVVDVPTSGHFVPEEAPEVVVDALVGLIG